MSLTAIEQLLGAEIGLDPRSIGHATIDLAVRRRREEVGSETNTQYLEHLRRSPDELQHLVERVVVSNTWFFRERGSFDFVTRSCEGRTSASPLRILSLGCANGAEPYSLAIALLDRLGPAARFQIEAIDISRQALQEAAEGRFRATAFHGHADPGTRSRYFQRQGDTYLISDAVKERVRFVQGNVLRPEPYPPPETCHFVFCRNLLIYMNDDARARTLALIGRVLRPAGHLLVASAEGGRLPRDMFEPVRLEGRLGFRKARASDKPGPASRAAPQRPSVAPLAPRVTAEIDPSPLRLTTAGDAARREARCWEQTGLFGDAACPLREQYGTCSACPRFTDHGRTLFDRPAPPGYVEYWTDAIRRSKLDQSAEQLTVLVFRVSGQWLALAADRVLFVAKPGTVRSIPHRSGQVFRGLVNLMGIRICVSLGGMLEIGDLPPPRRRDRQRMIAFGSTEQSWVFPVDEVNSVRRFDAAQLDQAPLGLSEGSRTYTLGTLAWRDRTVGLLDADLLAASLARIVQ